jgi:bacterioferritin
VTFTTPAAVGGLDAGGWSGAASTATAALRVCREAERENSRHLGLVAASAWQEGAGLWSAHARGSPLELTGEQMANAFAIDVTRIRDEARQHLKQGPVTPSNTTDVGRVITVLNQVVATEMVCYLRYTQNAIVAQGIDREQVASMFQDHAAEELGHFQRVSDRINQLGGSPDMDPGTMMERTHTQYTTTEDTDLQGMIRENLVAERIVIAAYAEIIRWLGDADITSRRLIEQILKEEEDHADELNDLFTG